MLKWEDLNKREQTVMAALATNGTMTVAELAKEPGLRDPSKTTTRVRNNIRRIYNEGLIRQVDFGSYANTAKGSKMVPGDASKEKKVNLNQSKSSEETTRMVVRSFVEDQQHGRESSAMEVARRIGVSRGAVIPRLKRLNKSAASAQLATVKDFDGLERIAGGK